MKYSYHFSRFPEKCPDCNGGVLVKTCAYCGKDFDNFKCLDS